MLVEAVRRLRRFDPGRGDRHGSSFTAILRLYRYRSMNYRVSVLSSHLRVFLSPEPGRAGMDRRRLFRWRWLGHVCLHPEVFPYPLTRPWHPPRLAASRELDLDCLIGCGKYRHSPGLEP
jgi:hypothetical protein